MTATVSNHLPQFDIIPNMFGNISGNKSNIYEREWSKFDQENFILDYFSVDWEDLFKTDEPSGDNLAKIYLDKINMLLDTYAPLKKINKYKLKCKSKPWITSVLQKSIFVKNKKKMEYEEHIKRNQISYFSKNLKHQVYQLYCPLKTVIL